MDYKQAAREWSQGTFRPVYVLYGSESYVMGEWLDLLTRTFLDPETRDFALSKYDFGSTPLETVLEDAQTPPFLASRKLVIAQGAYFLTGSRDPSKVEHRIEALQSYLDRTADDVVVVLTVPADKLDERKKIVKALKQSATTLAFAPLGASELPAWVGKKASARGVRMEQDAIECLLERVGGNCALLASEIEKLSLFAGKGGTIRRDTVERLAIRTSEQNVFQLVEEIAKLRLERAITIFHDLLKEKEEPVKLLALIARQFRLMLGAQELSRQGLSQGQIASRLGAHPYAVRMAGEQAKRFRPETLGRILAELADLDFAIKSGRMDKVLALELFILRLGAAAAAVRTNAGAAV